MPPGIMPPPLGSDPPMRLPRGLDPTLMYPPSLGAPLYMPYEPNN